LRVPSTGKNVLARFAGRRGESLSGDRECASHVLSAHAAAVVPLSDECADGAENPGLMLCSAGDSRLPEAPAIPCADLEANAGILEAS